jgi:hypothetical protein
VREREEEIEREGENVCVEKHYVKIYLLDSDCVLGEILAAPRLLVE